MAPDTGQSNTGPLRPPDWCYLCSGLMVPCRGIRYCPTCDYGAEPVRRFWVYDSDQDQP